MDNTDAREKQATWPTIVVSDANMVRLSQSILLATGNVRVGYAEDCVIIACGAVDISHSRRSIILAAHFVGIGSDGTLWERDCSSKQGADKWCSGSVIASGSVVSVGHGFGSVCCAPHLVSVAHAHGVTFVGSPTREVSHEEMSTTIDARGAANFEVTENPLQDKVRIAVIRRRNDGTGFVKIRGTEKDYEIRLGDRLVDEQGMPVDPEVEWKLIFVSDGYGLFSDGSRLAGLYESDQQK